MLGRTLDEKAQIISPEDYPDYDWDYEHYPEDLWFWEVEIFNYSDEEHYWDSISWPNRYVSDLDYSRTWASGWDWYGKFYRQEGPRGKKLGFFCGEVPKHLRYKPFEAYKHWRGESRRRQYYKDKAKSHQRMATRDAFKGSPKQLKRGWIATAWDIN